MDSVYWLHFLSVFFLDHLQRSFATELLSVLQRRCGIVTKAPKLLVYLVHETETELEKGKI